MSKNILHIIVTALCCLLTVFATLTVSGSASDSKYASKNSVVAIAKQVENLDSQNREDHKEIRIALRQILQELGRIQGKTGD